MINLGVLGSTKGTDLQAIINAISEKRLNAKISVVISNNSQAFSAEILGINISNQRFRKISNLNPNQSLNFSPRSRRSNC